MVAKNIDLKKCDSSAGPYWEFKSVIFVFFVSSRQLKETSVAKF